MAKINNTNTIKEVLDGAAIQTSHDQVPQELGKTVVPVMEVNPKLLRRVGFMESGTRTSSGSTTLVTLKTDRDVWVTGFVFSSNFDAASVVTTSELRLNIGGSQRTVQFALTNGEILQQEMSHTFVTPILIDRGTNVYYTLVTSAGTYSVAANVYGYYVED